MSDSPLRTRLQSLIEEALIDNGGLDYDLMTRCTEKEVAEFAMTYMWPEVLRAMGNISQREGLLSRCQEALKHARQIVNDPSDVSEKVRIIWLKQLLGDAPKLPSEKR